ncbi:MAG: tripartite tricarboxylate transporter TctB family protein [Candidatus Nanopelagicaceae bacterium]|jgi:putative tricarboxylic transport membrane protein
MTKVTRAVVAEAVFALGFLLLGLFVLYDAFTLEEPGVYSVVSPKTFEYIIGGFATVVGGLLILEVSRGKYGVAEGTEPGQEFLPPDVKTMSIVIGSMLLHIFLIEPAGYIAAATLTFYGVSFAFGSRKFIKDIALAFIFAVVVYFVFSKGLRIFLPDGFFENLLGLARETQG